MRRAFLAAAIAGSLSVIVALVAVSGPLSTPARAAQGFAGGVAQISAPCRIQFVASPSGGYVAEQCDFGKGLNLYHGRVLCYASNKNVATFVWTFNKDNERVYQQVWITDNGLPFHGARDQFINFPESTYNPCDYGALDPTWPGDETSGPVLWGNFIVVS